MNGVLLSGAKAIAHGDSSVISAQRLGDIREAFRFGGAGAAIYSEDPERTGTPKDWMARILTQELPEAMGMSIHPSDTFTQVRVIEHRPDRPGASIALSLQGHPPHTDGTFEKEEVTVFALAVTESDSGGGGLSLFWPIAECISWLRTQDQFGRALEVLTECPVTFSRQEGERTSEATRRILNQDGDRLTMSWRDDPQVSPRPVGPMADECEEALALVRNWLATTPPIVYVARPGDVMVVQNTWGVLHGRSPLSARSLRSLGRTWFN
jgi:hypothetical protein